ncbi:MAG: hypothetical protein WCY10_03990 [Candidatus Omnitrophota bacterium]
MKKHLATASVVLSMVFSGIAFAAGDGVFSDLGIAVSGDMSYYSEYLWRGFLLDGDPVAQTGIYVAGPATPFGKLTAKFWTSKDMDNRDSRLSDEFDYILDYTYDFSAASVSVGHTYYDFPDQTGTDGAPKTFSREFYAGVTLPKVLLTPSVFVYRDYGDQNDGGGLGNYFVLNLAYSVPVEMKNYKCSLDLSGHYGYNHHLFIRGNGGDIGLGAGFTVPLTKSMTVTPGVNYSAPLGDLKEKSDGAQEARVFSGVTLKYSF